VKSFNTSGSQHNLQLACIKLSAENINKYVSSETRSAVTELLTASGKSSQLMDRLLKFNAAAFLIGDNTKLIKRQEYCTGNVFLCLIFIHGLLSDAVSSSAASNGTMSN
jgi:hypothetical protein